WFTPWPPFSKPRPSAALRSPFPGFDVRSSMPARDTDFVACSRKRSLSELDVRCSTFDVSPRRVRRSLLRDYHGLWVSVTPGQLSVRNGTAGNPMPLKRVAAGLACQA